MMTVYYIINKVFSFNIYSFNQNHQTLLTIGLGNS